VISVQTTTPKVSESAFFISVPFGVNWVTDRSRSPVQSSYLRIRGCV
jgi:hypothetical protein